MADFDFGHLTEDAKVRADQTRDYTFDDLKGSPVLKCLPATDENLPYRNERLGRINKRRKDLKRGINITPALVAKARAEDRELYARHCIKGWDRVNDKSGKPVPFSAEAAKAFLDAIPDYIFDEFRGWIGEPTNFTAETDPEDEDGESLGEFSPTT